MTSPQPLGGVPSVAISSPPSSRLSIASVMMIGGMRRKLMPVALMKPTATEASSAMAMDAASPQPARAQAAATTLESVTTLETDRSMPPEMTQMACPMTIMPV